MRPLIDTTLLRLWDGPETDQAPVPVPEAPAPKPCGRCLHCGRPTLPGKTCCSAKCKAKWQAGMSRWHQRLEKTSIDQDTELF